MYDLFCIRENSNISFQFMFYIVYPLSFVLRRSKLYKGWKWLKPDIWYHTTGKCLLLDFKGELQFGHVKWNLSVVIYKI